MPLACAIYGYEITCHFTVGGMQFFPITNSFQEAHEAARNLNEYQLTGIVISNEFSGDVLFRLETVLSFIEHLDVIVTKPVEFDAIDPSNLFSKTLKTSRRHNGGGAMISSDNFFPDSRPLFIEKALQLLDDSAYCETTGYRTLFFKVSETFRQRKPFIEVSYFLLFSGLETYVRKSLNNFDSKSEISVLFQKHLSNIGFNVFSFKETQLERSMDTYARLRNAIFHNSKFEAHRIIRGQPYTYKLADFYAQFMTLAALVVLKATGFDDGHTNWDAWIDRQLFK